MPNKTPKEATKTPADEPESQSEWVEWAKAKMMAMEARIETLKHENRGYKQTIRNQDRRIMKGRL